MKLNHFVVIAAGASILGLAGCGTTPATTQNITNKTSNTSASQVLQAQTLNLTILPGGKLGSDGKMHDTYSPGNETLVAGVPTTITIYNYDNMKHSYTISQLGVNIQATPSAKNGVPGITKYTFTPKESGSFTWHCTDPCDLPNKGWSMSHMGYMEGTLKVLPNATDKQYVYLTIKDGLKYAKADGKLHDAYSPTDFTVQKGVPVTVVVTNFDTGEHSMYAPTLNVNQTMKGATKTGVPTTTTFTFTPKKDGTFNWRCMIPCDGGMTSYSMTHQGYMQGKITVTG